MTRETAINKLDLPIGYSAFREIREWNCYYVDKTPHIWRLARRPGYYFLSRPRRFGKTLLVDTLQELFEGSEELFRGLHIHDRWDWSVRHPVVRLSFGSDYRESGSVDSHVIRQLIALEKLAGVEPPPLDYSGAERLQYLIGELHHQNGRQVVVLVDEYDKPILDLLERKDQAKANRDYLRGLYGIIKDCARQVRFVFVTGISMYSKGSLFSGLNNLRDISLSPKYNTICGYTDADLDTVFAPELSDLDREDIRTWYNGYSWDWRGGEKVYNPFDVLLLFEEREFEPYWYETGTLGFLRNLMAAGRFSTQGLEHLEMHRSELSTFEVEKIRLNALLFQCGYLTIQDRQVRSDGDYCYLLGYPNQEVRRSLNRELLGTVSGDLNRSLAAVGQLSRLLADRDFEGFGVALHSFYAGIPHQWHDVSEVARYEAFYASVLYASLMAVRAEVRAEESTVRGRSDLVVLCGGQVFVLEIKVVVAAREVESKVEEALAQMREKGYADRYRGRGEAIHLIAVVFSGEERNLAALRVEEVRGGEKKFVI